MVWHVAEAVPMAGHVPAWAQCVLPLWFLQDLSPCLLLTTACQEARSSYCCLIFHVCRQVGEDKVYYRSHWECFKQWGTEKLVPDSCKPCSSCVTEMLGRGGWWRLTCTRGSQSATWPPWTLSGTPYAHLFPLCSFSWRGTYGPEYESPKQKMYSSCFVKYPNTLLFFSYQLLVQLQTLYFGTINKILKKVSPCLNSYTVHNEELKLK